MIKMLVLSDKLLLQKDAVTLTEKVDVYPWNRFPNIPRPSDYEIVVLDMQISADRYGGAFLGLREEVAILLKSGGVVVCLNYFTKRTNHTTYWNSRKSNHPAVIRHSSDKRWEINYDWMFSHDLFSSLNVAQLDAKPGKHFVLKSKGNVFSEYFKGVIEYHKTIDNVTSEEDEDGTFLGYGIYVPGWPSPLDTKVIAVAKVTKMPISCVISILDGILMFLPQSNAEPKTVIDQLYAIGKSEYEKNIERTEEYPSAPEWLNKYKTDQELDLERKAADVTSKLEQIKLEIRRFEKIDVLLYGTGTPLEVAVQKVLEEMGCTVEVMEKGATIDLKAKIDSMKFAIEITGVDEKIYKKNRKFGQILQYLPMKEENEKIVLLVNTYKDIDVKERIGRENFTGTVQEMANNNRFCLMTTKDLYFMWKDFLNGTSAQKMLTEVFSTKGEFRYSKA